MSLFKKISFLLFIAFSSCSAQQEETNNAIEILYKAQTRGNLITISFKQDKLIFMSSSDDKTIILTKELQKEIQLEVSKIGLSKISNLKAPSDKRFTDGALSASFKIKDITGSYTSSDFDHKNPPEELKPLYILLESIIKKG